METRLEMPTNYRNDYVFRLINYIFCCPKTDAEKQFTENCLQINEHG